MSRKMHAFLLAAAMTMALLVLALGAQAQNLYVGGFSWSPSPGYSNILEFTPDGVQSTFASNLNSGSAFCLAFDASGNLYAPDFGNGLILKFTPGGVQSVFASGISPRAGLAFDGGGNLFVSDWHSGCIYAYNPAGARSTFASGLSIPAGLAFDRSGNLFEADYSSGHIYKFTPAGVRTTFGSGLSSPIGLAFDASGNLFVSNFSGGSITTITPAGVQSTFAAGLSKPMGLAFDTSGNLFESNYSDGSIFKFTPGGIRSTFVSVRPDLVVAAGLAFGPITVNPVNYPPVASGQSVTTLENTTFSGMLTAADLDNDPLTFSKVSDPLHGSVIVNADGSFSYTPAANYTGADSFTFKANDGQADSNTAIVSITVTAPNHPPVANPDTATTAVNKAVTIGVLANDTDPDGDPLTVVSVTPPAKGALTIVAGNSVTYTPNKRFTGTERSRIPLATERRNRNSHRYGYGEVACSIFRRSSVDPGEWGLLIQ